MSKVRINDLARELEVKSKAILDVLEEVGVTEKKTHSSSLEDHEADKVRAHFRGSSEGHGSSRSARASHAGPEEIKTKIDLSHISKPGDVLKAIIGNKQPPAPSSAPAAPPRPVAPPPHEAKPAASVAPPAVKPSAPPVPPPVAPAVPPPRMVTPASVAAQRRPVPGQPISQRPRPAAPGTRPPMRPGEHRPMHPTRTGPAGARPIGVGPGLPPPGPSRPGARPGGPARRPGQRYVPRGVKEGPMKGFVPPPRLSLPN